MAVIDPRNPAAAQTYLLASPEFSPPPVLVDGKLFVGLNATKPLYAVVDPRNPPKKPGFFARLFGGGNKSDAQLLPTPNMAIDHIHLAGRLILFQMRPYDGGDGRRIVGVDAGTGAVRFDSGMLSEEPVSMVPAQIQAREDIFVYVTSPSNDDNHCELRAVDIASGQVRWTQPIGDWTHHYILDDVVVVYLSGETTLVLDLATGTTVSAYPFSS